MIVKIVCAAVEERSEYSVKLKSIFSSNSRGTLSLQNFGCGI